MSPPRALACDIFSPWPSWCVAFVCPMSHDLCSQILGLVEIILAAQWDHWPGMLWAVLCITTCDAFFGKPRPVRQCRNRISTIAHRRIFILGAHWILPVVRSSPVSLQPTCWRVPRVPPWPCLSHAVRSSRCPGHNVDGGAARIPCLGSKPSMGELSRRCARSQAPSML